MEGNSQERGKWKELPKLPMALVSFFFFLMLKSRVPYMLLHLRNLSGGVISIITVLNFLWVWLENLAGNTFLKDKSR